MTHAGCGPLIPACEGSHHTAQLQCFITTVGPAALRDVQALHVTMQHNPACGGHLIRTTPSFVAIASLIATACPNITHLAIEGSQAELAVAAFGAVCSKIISFRLVDCVERSHFNTNLTACVAALRPAFPGLLRLCVESEIDLIFTKDWQALPHTLEELHCYEMPLRNLQEHLSQGLLTFPALQTLHIRMPLGYRWNVVLLSSLLEAAPKLHTIRSQKKPCIDKTVNWTGDDVSIECVHLEDLQAMQHLKLRLGTGLNMDPILLDFGRDTSVEQSAQQLPVETVLAAFSDFPTVVSCSLDVGGTRQNASCLARLASVFPNLQRLRLAGSFTDETLSHLVSFNKLQSMNLAHARLLTGEGLARLMVCAPNINHIQRPWDDPIRTEELLRLMELAHAEGTSDEHIMSPINLGDWAVARTETKGCTGRGWVRHSYTSSDNLQSTHSHK